MKGYYIEITNNLLEPKHRKRMGTAIWEFMWCLDKITKIDDDGLGWVYGGRPINLKEIKEEIGITEPKISKNLNKLKKEGYLDLLRTPYGIVIKVWKSKKRFAQKVKSDLTKRENPSTLKGKSNIRQDTTIHKDKTPIIKFFKNGNERRLFPVGDPPEEIQDPAGLEKYHTLKAPLLRKVLMVDEKERTKIQEEVGAEIRVSGKK